MEGWLTARASVAAGLDLVLRDRKLLGRDGRSVPVEPKKAVRPARQPFPHDLLQRAPEPVRTPGEVFAGALPTAIVAPALPQRSRGTPGDPPALREGHGPVPGLAPLAPAQVHSQILQAVLRKQVLFVEHEQGERKAVDAGPSAPEAGIPRAVEQLLLQRVREERQEPLRHQHIWRQALSSEPLHEVQPKSVQPSCLDRRISAVLTSSRKCLPSAGNRSFMSALNSKMRCFISAVDKRARERALWPSEFLPRDRDEKLLHLRCGWLLTWYPRPPQPPHPQLREMIGILRAQQLGRDGPSFAQVHGVGVALLRAAVGSLLRRLGGQAQDREHDPEDRSFHAERSQLLLRRALQGLRVAAHQPHERRQAVLVDEVLAGLEHVGSHEHIGQHVLRVKGPRGGLGRLVAAEVRVGSAEPGVLRKRAVHISPYDAVQTVHVQAPRAPPVALVFVVPQAVLRVEGGADRSDAEVSGEATETKRARVARGAEVSSEWREGERETLVPLTCARRSLSTRDRYGSSRGATEGRSGSIVHHRRLERDHGGVDARKTPKVAKWRKDEKLDDFVPLIH
eukprot:scaffold1583_cov299-Pinguiococcus_pyrenoidosus.AAC.6